MPENERLTMPPVSEASWARYEELRKAPLNGMRHGVLPNIAATLDSYQALDDSLTNENGGGYEDDDQADLATYHPLAIALVASAIESMRQKMREIEAIAQSVDAAFVAAGRAPLFGVRMPEEQPNG